jgi:hypothetical protein
MTAFRVFVAMYILFMASGFSDAYKVTISIMNKPIEHVRGQNDTQLPVYRKELREKENKWRDYFYTCMLYLQ